MAEERDFTLRIITPERVFYEGKVDMVEFNTTEGEIGVLPGHIPLTVIIKPGVLNIYEPEGQMREGHRTQEGNCREAALHAGFAQILPEGITILAEIIEWPDEIDEKRAEEAKHRAEERLHSKTPETDIARAETALDRAIARIQVLK